MKPYFDHEKLDVYQQTIQFNAWLPDLLEAVPARFAVRDQLDRSATSIALNIAEGNGKFSSRDRVRFLEIAYGSTVECAACLDVLVARRLVPENQVEAGKTSLARIVSMLVELISAVSSRIREDAGTYGSSEGGRIEYE